MAHSLRLIRYAALANTVILLLLLITAVFSVGSLLGFTLLAVALFVTIASNTLLLLMFVNEAGATNSPSSELTPTSSPIEAQDNERTQALAEAQARLYASINSVKIGFILTNDKLSVMMVNGTTLATVCAPPPGSQGSSALSACTLESIQASLGQALDIKAQCQTCLREQKQLEFPAVPIGDKFFRFYISPVVMDKRAIGVVILVDDMTEEKMLERSKDEFFSIASHELRTPLTAIRGNADMIKAIYSDKLPDKDFQEMVNDIHEGSVRLIAIVNDFLSVSRLEQKRLSFKIEPMDLTELSSDVIKEVQSLAEEKQDRVVLEPPPTPLPNVQADKDRVKEILINLVGNAIKFTKNGSVTIRLTQEGHGIKTQVIDTGAGIPADNQALLFRKFQQAGNSIITRDTTQGTGLGLYISKLMVEAMHGEIKLESSEAGKGSVFSFTLPIAEEGASI